MEKGLFSNATFGKLYRCRDGSKAAYLRAIIKVQRMHKLIKEDKIGIIHTIYVDKNGSINFGGKPSDDDIIGEWEEEPQWKPCTDDNYWEPEDSIYTTIVCYEIEGAVYVRTQENCPYGWSTLIKMDGKFMTLKKPHTNNDTEGT